MTSRMERKLDAVPRQNLAVSHGLDRDVAEALAKDRGRLAMADISLRAGTCMVGMGVGDDRALNRSPGIDVKIAGRAIKPAVG